MSPANSTPTTVSCLHNARQMQAAWNSSPSPCSSRCSAVENRPVRLSGEHWSRSMLTSMYTLGKYVTPPSKFSQVSIRKETSSSETLGHEGYLNGRYYTATTCPCRRVRCVFALKHSKMQTVRIAFDRPALPLALYNSVRNWCNWSGSVRADFTSSDRPLDRSPSWYALYVLLVRLTSSYGVRCLPHDAGGILRCSSVPGVPPCLATEETVIHNDIPKYRPFPW